MLSSAPAADLAEKFGFPIWRGQTLLAGAFVLAEAQRRLGVPLVVARAGLREGAVLESLLRGAGRLGGRLDVALGHELVVHDPGRALLELPVAEPRQVTVRADGHVLAA